MGLLMVMALSTAFGPVAFLPDREDCRVHVQKTVTFELHNNGTTSSIKADLPEAVDSVHGLLELCVDRRGNCTWTFDDQTTNGYQVEVPALEHLIQMVFTSAMSIDEYVEIARSKGTSITELGNHTLSITEEDKANDLTIITLVDTEKKVILGSNVYQNKRNLTTKVICKYEHDNGPGVQLQELSLLIWKGDTLTEMVFKNF